TIFLFDNLRIARGILQHSDIIQGHSPTLRHHPGAFSNTQTSSRGILQHSDIIQGHSPTLRHNLQTKHVFSDSAISEAVEMTRDPPPT
ncbi:hypothetical protein J4Q44_G00109730, partial [Coregonus suidteri]